MAGYRFQAELYLWDARTDSWVFANLPEDIADEIEDLQVGPRRGFGAVKVEVSIGDTTWRTSMFPSKQAATFVLPVKRAILKDQDLKPGDHPTFELELVAP
jgi:hypothetical protein